MRKIIYPVLLLLSSALPSPAQSYAEVSSLRSENRILLARIDSLQRELKKLKGELEVKSWDELDGLEAMEWTSASPVSGRDEYSSADERATAARTRLSAPFLIIPYRSAMMSYIDFYGAAKRHSMPVILRRYDSLFPAAVEAFRRHGVPEDLVALCIVESAVSPKAKSKAGAYGMWQFMPATARQYGMQVNELVDERDDVALSTEAAARLLADNYRALGSWPLAVLAYNCGVGNVRKAIIRSGGSREYWDIHPYLPKETQGYLLSLIAVRYVLCNRDEFGFGGTIR